MEFPDLSMGQYITRQYTQNVANALSSVTNVPSTSISALDVRPFTGSSGSGRRRLLQSSGNGVQVSMTLNFCRFGAAAATLLEEILAWES
jgi:hypothetical protein